MLATSRLFAVLGLMIVSLTIIPLSNRFGWTGAALIIGLAAYDLHESAAQKSC